MISSTALAFAAVSSLLQDPGMTLFRDLGLSFSDASPPRDLIEKIGLRAQCGESTPGSTSCRSAETLGGIAASVVLTVAHGTHEAFVESVSVFVEDAPPGLYDVVRRWLSLRHEPVAGADSEWCGGDHLISLGGGPGVTVTYWNLFKRDTSICREGRIVKLIPYVIPGGSSRPPAFFGLGSQLSWAIGADEFHDDNPEYATWTSERGKGRGLSADQDVMLREAEVTYFFGTVADTLSEVRVRWRGVSRRFKERVVDQLKEIFRYHAAFEYDEGALVRARLCKEDLHLYVEDVKPWFTVSMTNNPDGFCVD